MTWIIIPKNSTTVGAVPTTSDLSDGEIALNSVDRKLFQRVGSNIIDFMARPYARVAMSADYVVPNTGVRLLPFDTAISDSSGIFDAANSRVVPNVPGLYHVVLCAYTQSNATGTALSYHQVAARKNSDISLHGVSAIPSANGLTLVSLTHAAVMEMNGSTDYIDASVRTGIGVTVGKILTFLTVARIG
ncbi:MAG TPA: hypothetical protein VGE09_03385 [Pseudoxanthomonas sp.]